MLIERDEVVAIVNPPAGDGVMVNWQPLPNTLQATTSRSTKNRVLAPAAPSDPAAYRRGAGELPTLRSCPASTREEP
jgi:hypothetical protein